MLYRSEIGHHIHAHSAIVESFGNNMDCMAEVMHYFAKLLTFALCVVGEDM